MKTKYVPAIIMLSAGFIDCLLGIYNHLSLFEFTIQLLIVLVIFLIIGLAVKIALDLAFNQPEPVDDAETDMDQPFDTDDLEEISSDEEDENTNEY